MITPKDNPPREALERIAADYRRRGYKVMVAPRGKDLPSFLQSATPDIIAQRGDESLIIEVKNSPKEVDPQQLNAIATLVATQPSWRFVVIATQPNERAQEKPLTTLDETTIVARLREARDLTSGQHFEAGLLLAWAATEAAVRLMVAKQRIPVERDDPLSLIRSLVTLGYINEEQFRQLNEAFSLRSYVAHGRGPLPPEQSADTKTLTERLSTLSESLLKELATTAWDSPR